MTTKAKAGIWTIVAVIVIAAVAGYLYIQKHPGAWDRMTSQNSPSSQPQWTEVDKKLYPPHMPSGMPQMKNATVTQDRYYVDQDGNEHGQYFFTFTDNGQQSALVTAYLNILKKGGWNVTSSTDTSVVAEKDGYDVTVHFLSPAASQTEVDSEYTFNAPKK